MKKCPLALWEKKGPHFMSLPCWSTALAVEVQSHVFRTLIRRILSYANSPEKPDNMVDISKPFSFVTGKRLKDRMVSRADLS